MPERIQKQRVKGWKPPDNTVFVGRGSGWNNQFQFEGSPEAAYEVYKNALEQNLKVARPKLYPLTGKNLMCWCPLTYADGRRYPCHADILLKHANEETNNAE